MILQKLVELYEREVAVHGGSIAPFGWEYKEIPFVIVLNEDGTYLKVEDTREPKGKRKIAKTFLVPKSVKRSINIEANFLWDKAEYVLGLSNDNDVEKQEKTKKRNEAFINRIKKELPDIPRKRALLNFLETISEEKLVAENKELWQEILEKGSFMAFRFAGDQDLFCCTDEAEAVINKSSNADDKKGICMVTGKEDSIANLHAPIKNIGSQGAGLNIVSFNMNPFESYHKKQGFNAPVGERAMFSYTTALNDLLARDSNQKIVFNGITIVFWSDKKSALELDFSPIFNKPPKDDPAFQADKIKNLFQSVEKGSYLNDDPHGHFFILGLSPNVARLSIQFWKTGTIAYFSDKIREHFNDLEIVKPEREIRYYSLWRLLVNIAFEKKSKNIVPRLAGEMFQSIFDGCPYPVTLLQTTLMRIKNDKKEKISPVRAAIIKAYLNRYYRYYNKPNEKELTMSLDIEQPSKGYQLGRLFATLEKVQNDANPGVSRTIRERYYGSASCSPELVFPTLMRLKTHHLAKFEHKGQVIFFEKVFTEIVSRIDDFPSYLNMHEQGKFAIGYYHQNQYFYQKKETQEEKGEQHGIE